MRARRTLALLPTPLLLAACGGDGSKSGNATDRAFAAEMVPHHQSAVEMAKAARTRAQSPEVRELAASIERTQAQEIATLRKAEARLKADGVEKGKLGLASHEMGMGHDQGMLETAKPFDPAFVKMMVPHHEGAIRMARIELEKGSDPELKTLAREIVAAQEREIALMRRL